MMKTEILKAVEKRHSKNKDLSKILKKIESELTILSETEGIGAKNNLDTFYNIWKNHHGEVGHNNKINSWTAYFLGMTDVKPSGEFLATRRAFARAGFPDIDTDFDYENRDKVYAYIIDKYGRDNVGNIGTHGLLKFKSCVTRVVKALDLANAFHKGKDAFVSENAAKVSDILSSFPKKGLLKIKDSAGDSHLINSFSDAFEFCDDFRHYVDKYKKDNFRKHVEKIEGTFANFGSHAAGIVVSDVPLDEIAPLRNAKKGVLATQYPNEDLETLGLIKFDVLALSTLSVIQHTVEKIKKNWGIEIDLENMPMNDDATLQLYREGNLGGVFQCENYGMQKTMREIGVDGFSDIIAALALYRPGPMDSIPQYCARKKGEEAVNYWHPSIEKYVKPYLENTYGVLCVHEDTMISMADGTHKPIKNVKKSDMVLSYPDSTFVEEKMVCGCSPTRRCDGYKVTLSNGRAIILTDDHKVYTWEGMKEVKDLDMKTDLVGCPSVLCRGANTDKHNCFSWLGKDEDISYLVGMLIGDGNIHKGVNICVGDESKSEVLEQWLNSHLPKLKTHRYFHTRSWYISISCDELVGDWRKENCGNRKTKFGKLIDELGLRKNCYNKRIPSIIFTMSEESQRACLAGLIDSDGCISYGKDDRVYVNYTSVNRNLLEDVRHLCDWLEIETRIKDNKIYIQNVIEIKEEVVPYMVLKDIKEDAKVIWKCKTVFYKKSYVEEKRKLEGLSVRAFCKKHKISRSNYSKRDILSISALGNGKFINDYGFHKSHLLFYKIESIEKIDDVQFYGMSVADNHNLFGNGILISNCFQEQVMQICNALAGFTITDGYIMIKAIGKKKVYLMDKFEKQFVAGCANNGVPTDVAQQYWDRFITPFASYGFNLAHSACYGYNSYTTAYLKANYPDEFMCSLFDVTANSSVADKFDKVLSFEKEFKRKMNVKILSRDINKSKSLYVVEKVRDLKRGVKKSEIRPSLLCKGVSFAAAKEIEEHQPYKDLRSIVERTASRIVDVRTIEALAAEGYFGKKKRDMAKEVAEEFRTARDDVKKARGKKCESVDIFA